MIGAAPGFGFTRVSAALSESRPKTGPAAPRRAVFQNVREVLGGQFSFCFRVMERVTLSGETASSTESGWTYFQEIRLSFTQRRFPSPRRRKKPLIEMSTWTRRSLPLASRRWTSFTTSLLRPSMSRIVLPMRCLSRRIHPGWSTKGGNESPRSGGCTNIASSSTFTTLLQGTNSVGFPQPCSM